MLIWIAMWTRRLSISNEHDNWQAEMWEKNLSVAFVIMQILLRGVRMQFMQVVHVLD